MPHHPRIRSRISNDITSMHRRMNTVLADLPSGWAEMNAWELRLLHNMAAMVDALVNAYPHGNSSPA